MFEEEVAAVNASAELMAQQTQTWDLRYNRLAKAVNDALASRDAAAVSAAAAAAKAASNPPTGGTGGTGTGGTGGSTDAIMPGSVYTANGFDAALYTARAESMGTDAGVAYLYGLGPSAFGNGGNENYPTLFQNVDHDGNEFSKAWNPNDRYARGCTLGHCGSWQLGGPVHPNEAGMYSSNWGQAIWVPDNRSASVGGLGITDLISFECGANTATTKPELPWHWGGGGLDAVQAKKYKQDGKNVSYIVSIARSEGRPGWGISNLSVTRDGLVMVTGQNTGFNSATTQLAAGKRPTFIVQSNSNEFAFITVWDTNAQKGQVAVIAVAGTPQNGYLGTDPANWENYRGELRGCFPGVPNYGNISFLKVLGYIDLPAGMKCPSACSVSFYQYWGAYQQFQDNNIDNNGKGWDLRKEQHRAQFRTGGPRASAWASRGVLTVVSKDERMGVVFDLKNMLDYFRNTYTSTNGVGTVGLGAGQFPATFDENPSQMPVMGKVFNFVGRPTAVKQTRFDQFPRIMVATDDGTKGELFLINPGTTSSNNDGGTFNVANASIVGRVDIGRNCTCIATVIRHMGAGGREGGSGDASYFGKRIYANADFNHTVIINCRGDREIQWVEFNTNYTGGTIVRRLRDSRLLDPIWIEDNENHTTEHYELSCADYSGQVINYRYGPLIFWNHEGVMGDDPNNPIYYNWDVGLPPDGIKVTPTIFKGVTYLIECGGFFKVPGKVFQLAFANVF